MTTELVELAERMDRQARMDRRDGDEFAANRVEAFADELRDLASRAGGPDGFVLVPRDATFDMEDAGLRWLTGFQHMRKQDRRNAMANAYAAMLAAAPEPVGVG